MPPIHPSKLPGPSSSKLSSSKKNSRKPSSLPDLSTSIKKSTHLRFDNDPQDYSQATAHVEEEKDADEEDESSNGNSSASDESVSSNSDQSDANDDDDDAPPEVLSTVASKRDVIEKEKARKEFQKAAAVAKRQANKARDEKLKQSKAQAKSRVSKPDPSSSSDDDEKSDSEPTPSLPEPSSTNKKYLDPSLFVSAAKVLEKSRLEAEALEDTRNTSIKKKRKRSQRLDEQDRREIGDNTFVVRLSNPTHLVPSTRPESVSKFVINRLSHTKSRGSPLSLPKTTRTAKADLGSRKRTTLATTGSRKTNRPAAIFVRQPS